MTIQLTDDMIRELCVLTTRDEAGRHFTDSKPLPGGSIMSRVLADQYSRLSLLLSQIEDVACCL